MSEWESSGRPMDSVSLRGPTSPVFAGRKVIFIGEVGAFFTADAQRVRALGTDFGPMSPAAADFKD